MRSAQFDYANVIADPGRGDQVVVNMGVGRTPPGRKADQRRGQRPRLITSQKPGSARPPSPSRSSSCAGHADRCPVTLRGRPDVEFLDRLVSIALRAFATSGACRQTVRRPRQLRLRPGRAVRCSTGIGSVDKIDQPRGMDIAKSSPRRRTTTEGLLRLPLGFPFGELSRWQKALVTRPQRSQKFAVRVYTRCTKWCGRPTPCSANSACARSACGMAHAGELPGVAEEQLVTGRRPELRPYDV